jgi:hypothetical protein
MCGLCGDSYRNVMVLKSQSGCGWLITIYWWNTGLQSRVWIRCWQLVSCSRKDQVGKTQTLEKPDSNLNHNHKKILVYIIGFGEIIYSGFYENVYLWTFRLSYFYDKSLKTIMYWHTTRKLVHTQPCTCKIDIIILFFNSISSTK